MVVLPLFGGFAGSRLLLPELRVEIFLKKLVIILAPTVHHLFCGERCCSVSKQN